MPENAYASVILDTRIDQPLTYSIPDQWKKILQPGMRVSVLVRNTLQKGTIYSLQSTCGLRKVHPIKDLISDEATLTEDLFTLARWMTEYYCTNLQRVFKCLVPSSIRQQVQPKKQLFIELAQSKKETLTTCQLLQQTYPQQAKVLELLLKQKKGLLLTEILQQVSRSPVETLVKKKLIRSKQLRLDRSKFLLNQEFLPTKPKELNAEQAATLQAIIKSLNTFQTHLIHGITGSGKTEIYMQAIQKTLDTDKSALILVPEIALTSQLIEKFRARFPNQLAILHHRISLGERLDSWENIRQKKAQIVIGARSAVFSPNKDLGIIIVDEEHDSSYKQSEEAPAYHARDIAVMRGKINNCPVILGSATPSIESYTNAKKGKYQLSTIQIRAGIAKLPKVHIINMKPEFDKKGGFTHFSDALLEAIQARYKVGEQSLLFLNRRGYHSSLLCTSCSQFLKCPHCDLTLTFHQKTNNLLCHLCNFEQSQPKNCPYCKEPSCLQHKGAGTENVEKSLHAIFPDIRTLRIDRDTTRKKDSHEELFKEFRSGKADVLIGTQMIAKGLHFPSVTLVGILNTDSALQIPDFRSSERTFQLLTQVAGRSGRSELLGEVLIQTFLPSNPTIQYAARQNYTEFYKYETESRKVFNFPPYSHLARLIFSGPDEQKTLDNAARFYQQLKLPPTYQIYKITPCGYAKIKDLYRYQFLIQGPHILPLSRYLHKIQKTTRLSDKTRLFIDIDPQNTFF